MQDHSPGPLSYNPTARPAAGLIGFVALRLLGLWMSLSLLRAAGYAAAVTVTQGTDLSELLHLMIGVAEPLLHGLLGVFVAVFAEPLSVRLFRINGFHAPPVSGEVAVAVTAVCTGIVLVAMSAGDVVRIIAILFMSDYDWNMVVGSLADQGIPAVARVALGVVLFLRPQWLIAAWNRYVRMA